ncbi:porin family protein [Hyunsoonleella sp. 2307UL5-6]|uniref:porin family protein n=1 Tax=Hyunsoonleella sp. 2307UL5-6 TaxID=3384768 RepID=UPI0039BCE5AA
MRKVFLIFITLLLINKVSAQSETKIGLKFGVHYSGFTDGGEIVLADSFGFHAGFISEILLSDKFALQPELLFSQRKGQDGTKIGDQRKFYFVSERNYIDLPLNLKYLISDKFHVEIGPQFSFLLSDKNTITPSSSDSNPDSELIINGFDFSANLGVSFNPSEKIIIQLRLNHGFSKVVETFDSKNSMISLGLGYFIF